MDILWGVYESKTIYIHIHYTWHQSVASVIILAKELQCPPPSHRPTDLPSLAHRPRGARGSQIWGPRTWPSAPVGHPAPEVASEGFGWPAAGAEEGERLPFFTEVQEASWREAWKVGTEDKRHALLWRESDVWPSIRISCGSVSAMHRSA